MTRLSLTWPRVIDSDSLSWPVPRVGFCFLTVWSGPTLVTLCPSWLIDLMNRLLYTIGQWVGLFGLREGSIHLS